MRAQHLGRGFWIELSCALVGLLLAAVTLISREWIELLFGVDPDGGSGLLEWAIVVALLSASVASATLAGLTWRRSMMAR